MPRAHDGATTCRGFDKDIVWPLVWAVLRKEEVRKEAQAYFKKDWPTMGSFRVWCEDRESVDGHLSGLLAIFTWSYRAFCT